MLGRVLAMAERPPLLKRCIFRYFDCRTPMLAAPSTTLVDASDTTPRSDSMNDVLALCSDLPQRRLAKGDTLIDEALRTDRLYVLKSGSFDVMRNGVRIIVIGEPG